MCAPIASRPPLRRIAAVLVLVLVAAGSASAQGVGAPRPDRPPREGEPVLVAARANDSEVMPVRRGELVVTRLPGPVETPRGGLAQGDEPGGRIGLMLLAMLVLIARMVVVRT